MSDYLVFLEIAIEDVKASKLLFEKRLYPQSLFYFQQATEKVIKSIGIFHNVISKKELTSTIRHNVNKIFKKAIKNYKSKFPSLVDFNVDEQFKQIEEFIKLNELTKTIPFLINQINDFKSEIPELPFDLTKLSTPEEAFETLSKFDPNNTELDKLLDIKDNELFRSIFAEKATKLSNTLPNYLQSILVLFVLGCMTIDHVSSVRYPDINEMINPNLIYNQENLMVETLPIFLDNLGSSINNISEFYKINIS